MSGLDFILNGNSLVKSLIDFVTSKYRKMCDALMIVLHHILFQFPLKELPQFLKFTSILLLQKNEKWLNEYQDYCGKTRSNGNSVFIFRKNIIFHFPHSYIVTLNFLLGTY